ncbi:hypothetical protein SLA2020_484240 [Shorea laevis]
MPEQEVADKLDDTPILNGLQPILPVDDSFRVVVSKGRTRVFSMAGLTMEDDDLAGQLGTLHLVGVAQSSAAVQLGTALVVSNNLEGSQAAGCLSGALGDLNLEESFSEREQSFTHVEEDESLPESSGLKHSQEMQVYVPAELEGLEPLSIAPLAVGKGQQFPPQVSPSWLVEKVKDFYHTCRLVMRWL